MEILAIVIPGIILALLLSTWAHFADDRRSLAISIYVIFGLGALGLIGLGGLIALLADQLNAQLEEDVFGVRSGLFMVAAGLAVGLALIPQFRQLLARVTPIKPTSMPDMVGLVFILVIPVVMIFTIDATFSDANGETEFGTVDNFALVAQTVLLVAIAFFAVGGAINRDFSSVRDRLGLHMPTMRQVVISVALVVPLLIISAIGAVLTDLFQPGFTDEIDDIVGEVTADLINVQGAILIGLSAGIGEEVLFRGAMQPTFGIVITSLVFMLIHVQYGFSFILLSLFATSVVFGIQRIKMNTTCCIITHATYNFVVVMLSVVAATQV
ncbi:MAG: CPBP family intramembrane metalloprotease [Sphaerobacteraceae bacterium]|nr:MAG: CPBP family intramembrane metalloprotease [Sphaerobacteraceae bacterium]